MMEFAFFVFVVAASLCLVAIAVDPVPPPINDISEWRDRRKRRRGGPDA